ncbi:hypothetical protein DRP05_11810 [Archaeoglobales archaeon]|nr:MAG: hypothetical protein DRP05_11810 [Archaeoglobales archaeon]
MNIKIILLSIAIAFLAGIICYLVASLALYPQENFIVESTVQGCAVTGNATNTTKSFNKEEKPKIEVI